MHYHYPSGDMLTYFSSGMKASGVDLKMKRDVIDGKVAHLTSEVIESWDGLGHQTCAVGTIDPSEKRDHFVTAVDLHHLHVMLILEDLNEVKL